MKILSCSIYLLAGLRLLAQPCPVEIKVTFEGKVIVATDSLQLVQHNIPAQSDSVHCVVTGFREYNGNRKDTIEEEYDIETSHAQFSFCQVYPISTMQEWNYPYFNAYNKNTDMFRVNDTLAVVRRQVDRRHCNLGIYTEQSDIITENWIYNMDGKLKKVITHMPDRCDTNSIVFSFEWSSTGKLTRVTEVQSIRADAGWYRYWNTMEMLYDVRDNLTAHLAYQGPPMDSLTTSLAEWEGQLMSWDGSSAIKDHNEVRLLFLFRYKYDNDLLQSALAYDNTWGRLICDTLEYDRKGHVTKFKTNHYDINYSYNKKGQLIAASQYAPVQTGVDTYAMEEVISDSYYYDKKGRITEMNLKWRGEFSFTRQTLKFAYR